MQFVFFLQNIEKRVPCSVEATLSDTGEGTVIQWFVYFWEACSYALPNEALLEVRMAVFDEWMIRELNGGPDRAETFNQVARVIRQWYPVP